MENTNGTDVSARTVTRPDMSGMAANALCAAQAGTKAMTGTAADAPYAAESEMKAMTGMDANALCAAGPGMKATTGTDANALCAAGPGMKATIGTDANAPYVEKSGTKATIWINTAHAGSVARHITNGYYRTQKLTLRKLNWPGFVITTEWKIWVNM